MVQKKSTCSCCKEGCGLPAEWAIIDVNDPNPFEREVHSCSADIDDLLGHREDMPDGVPFHFEIIDILDLYPDSIEQGRSPV